jgi:hypothetical protein
MPTTIPYTEEAFGILTDDNLYLDCVLVKPANMADNQLRMLRVWVPKYPLPKNSTITCARQEVRSYGADGRIAHLVFDLRGTGDSDGVPGDQSFSLDLKAIRAWAEERFGRINFGFLGFPYSEKGRVYVWPLRQGTMMESYYYHPAGTAVPPPTLLYLSSYGNFTVQDDARCIALARAGYSTYALDPLRYLLHASAERPLTPEDLREDLHILLQMLPSPPVIIAHPLAAGLGLVWTAENEGIKGIIAIGRAQSGLAASHIFHNRNPHNFKLSRYASNIAPRPVVYVQYEGHPLGGDPGKLKALYDQSKEPRRLTTVSSLSADFLLDQINWIEENGIE